MFNLLRDLSVTRTRDIPEEASKRSGDKIGDYYAGRGGLTLGDDIADLAGLTVALDAYHRSLGGKRAPVIEGMTGDQRLYYGWAQVWRIKYREQALQQVLLSDHSPGRYRGWMVRNLDPGYAAFGVKPGQALYLPPARRVRIW